MKSMVLTMVIILATASLAAAQRAEPGNPSVIVVSGEAQTRVAPDEATVRMGVVRQAKTAALAQDQTNTVAKEILTAVSQAGIPATEIKTAGLRLSPMFEDRTQPPRISGYQASNVVTIRIVDLNKIGPVIDAGLKAGANEVQGVQFGLRDDLPARQQALKQAVIEARKKAETIAETLNVEIVKPIEISENGVSVMPRGEGGVMMMRSAEAAMAPTPVSPGDIEIRANVTIRYQIVPKR